MRRQLRGTATDAYGQRVCLRKKMRLRRFLAECPEASCLYSFSAASYVVYGVLGNRIML
jgi:hypothetical protein